MSARYPERIVCLTEETTETLYLLGEERRIVGISGYTVRPPRGAAAAEAPARLLRGMGQPDDQRHPLGKRAGLDRWRRRRLRRALALPGGDGSHRHFGCGEAGGARHPGRLVVRKEIPARTR